ncbi:hypothetical protein J6590_000364 [Homalodisca vitripennis]|nr:hypothetical protein J6590_000364 [Homalodisca vitripennis]
MITRMHAYWGTEEVSETLMETIPIPRYDQGKAAGHTCAVTRVSLLSSHFPNQASQTTRKL